MSKWKYYKHRCKNVHRMFLGRVSLTRKTSEVYSNKEWIKDAYRTCECDIYTKNKGCIKCIETGKELSSIDLAKELLT